MRNVLPPLAMRLDILGLCFFSLTLNASNIRAATVPVAGDSYSKGGKTTTAAGKASTLIVDASRTAFVRFDLSHIPASSTIRYARLRIFLSSVTRPGSGLTVHEVSGAWTEDFTQPSPAFDATAFTSFAETDLIRKKFVSVDVTELVQDWIAQSSGNGFAIQAVPHPAPKLTASVGIGAKEGSGSGYPAELEIELSPASGVITGEQLAAGSIDNSHLSTNFVFPPTTVTAGSVSTASLGQNVVTSEKLGADLTLAGITTGTFVGDGSRLTGLNIAAVDEATFMSWVPVGHPGNVADPETGNQFGAVAGSFRMGKFEVTNNQYAAFLNAVAATDPNGLYNLQMGSSTRGGIARATTTAGSYAYYVKKAMGDKPVNFVSWFDSVRFCNWMHNGMPVGAQGSNTTEDGAYVITSAGQTVTVGARGSGARVFLPTVNEWYKCAYFDPTKNGGTGGYWAYPAQTNIDAPPNTGAVNDFGEITNDSLNIANYGFGAQWNGQNGNVTTVGSGGPGGESIFGAADMAGNVWEWNETVIGQDRGARGGSWLDGQNELARSFATPSGTPTLESHNVGFRVARPF